MSFIAAALTPDGDDDPVVEIIVVENGTNTGNGQNQRSTNPIYCVYSPGLHCFLVSADFSLGAISMQVFNSVSFESTTMTVFGGEGLQVVPMNLNHGEFFVSFISSNGNLYSGSFTL